jgi:peptidoglycan/xylan/chitin deacetylase (PgdA/CDA1 family)
MNGFESSAEVAAAAALAVGGWMYAALWPGSQLFGDVVVAGSDPGEIALTYDDGPNTAATPQLLEVLAKQGVRATFFLIGEFVRQQPGLTREIVAAGHLVGNHTMTHPWLAWQSGARIRMEMHDCNRRIEDTIGAPVRLFRPPHGARRPVVFRVARELGLDVIQWNVMGYDWMAPDGKAEPHARILNHLNKGIARNRRRGRGSNVLLHDGGQLGMGQPRMASVRATELLLESAKREGSRFVTPDAWL